MTPDTARLPTLRLAILASALAFAVAVAGSLIFAVSLSQSIRLTLDNSTEQLLVEQRIADQIVSASFGQQLTAYRVLETPNAATLQEFRVRGEQAYAGIQLYLIRPMPVAARLKVETIKEAHEGFEVAAQHAFDLALSGETAAARERLRDLSAKAADLERAVRAFVSDRAQHRSQLRAVQEMELARLQRAMIALAIVLAAGAIVLALLLRRKVSLMLIDLAKAVSAVSDGDGAVRVAPQQYREFQLLADSVDSMAVKVYDARTQLETRHRELMDTVARLKRTQRELAQHEKLSAMGEMLAGLAHELNNPLAGILGIAEILKAELSASRDPEVHDLLATLIAPLLKESLRARDLVRNLLHFSRSDKQQLEEVLLSEALGVAIGLRRHAFSEQGLRITCDIEDSISVLARRQTLELAIINVMNNALDAMAHGGGSTLHIAARRAGERTLLEFLDDGPGFTEADRAFEPFYTTKDVGAGTGLGLSLVHRFVEEFGGSVWAENAEHGGARISMSLAAPPLDAHAIASVPTSTPLHTDLESQLVAPSRILVVDDEPSLRNVQRRILMQLSAEVETAESAEQALAMIQKGSFDVVITDLRMPGPMNGRDLLAWMERHRPDLLARTLVVTGDVQPHGDSGLPVPPARIILKPFDRTEYLQRVQSVLAGVTARR